MGAYTCQYGVVHKTCRCPTPHTIACDVPKEHNPAIEQEVDVTVPYARCPRLKNNELGKHENHPSHNWEAEWRRGGIRKWLCPGRSL